MAGGPNARARTAFNLIGARARFSEGKMIKDPCFYYPKEKRAAYDFEVHAVAVFIVGAKGKWRLCAECAALPEFKRYRKRKAIERKQS